LNDLWLVYEETETGAIYLEDDLPKPRQTNRAQLKVATQLEVAAVPSSDLEVDVAQPNGSILATTR
jgi:hypothetical protein